MSPFVYTSDITFDATSHLINYSWSLGQILGNFDHYVIFQCYWCKKKNSLFAFFLDI